MIRLKQAVPLTRWGRVYSCMLWLFRGLRFVIRLWLGSNFVDQLLKSSQSNAENHSDITEGVVPGNGRQEGTGVHPARLSTKHGVRIGLILLGILVFVSLFVLVRILWAI